MFLKIPGDSANHHKLVKRSNGGNIKKVEILYRVLGQKIGRRLDEQKPLVIIYYPGKDPCNSSGSASSGLFKQWYGDLRKGLDKIGGTELIYLYKDAQGLDKKSFLDWHKDPDNTIEKLFFQYHYPCSSFVVISNTGEYLSYFGEFSKEAVWAATQALVKTPSQLPN